MPFSPCDPAAGSCTDVSVGILQWIFGPVVEKLTQGASPDAVDASVSVMASIFSVFNSGLLVVASLIVSYVAVMGVTNTANEGEAMGRNWSSLWTPVRIVSGGSVLLPTTSGYSFIQLIVMMFALWGVGFANTLFKIGTENGIINGALTATSAQMGLGSGAKPNPNYPLYDIRQFAQEYLAVAWCKRTVNASFSGFGGGTPNVSAAGTPDQTIAEGGIKEELGRIYAENVAQATAPNLNTLPQGPHSSLSANSYTTVYNTIISKSLTGGSYTTPDTPRAADLKSNLIPSSLDDLSIDTLGSRGDSFMSGFVQWGMERVTSTMIGTDGDVDAIARIKTTGDVLALLQSTGFAADRLIHTSLSGLKAAAAAVGSVSFMGNKVDATPLADTFLNWVIYNFLTPLAEVTTWLGRLAFYFGVFLPSLPYTIFMVAFVGWLMAVLQSIIAAPLWAVMHMTPDRTFVGSQTQGYLLLLSLFVRPALIITGLFAAMMVANPVVGYISKAFWAMYHANVTSAESLGWFIEFLQWKNWLIVYGFVLLPVMYMIFGLSQSLPDTVLRWIGAGISSMGETQATEQMRGQSEKYGPSALRGGASPKPSGNDGNDRRLNGDPGGAGSLSGPSGPTDNGGGGRSGGGNHPRLLNANGQGVAPQHDTPAPSASSSSAAPNGPTRSASTASPNTGSSLNTGSQGVVSRWGNREDITDAEYTVVKDTAPRSGTAARSASTGEKASNAVLALGSAGVISAASNTENVNDDGIGGSGLHYDSRYSPPPAAQASSVINHGDTTASGGQPA